MTSVGVPRQIIDDPKLVDLLNRLSNFDITATTSSSTVVNDGGKDDHEGDDDDGDVAMTDVTPDQQSPTVVAAASGVEGDITKPPLDIDGLVTVLEGMPKWKFQEQVR